VVLVIVILVRRTLTFSFIFAAIGTICFVTDTGADFSYGTAILATIYSTHLSTFLPGKFIHFIDIPSLFD
jgi:hypothetical protein